MMSRSLFGLAHTTAATLAVSSVWRLCDYSRTDYAPQTLPQSANIFVPADGQLSTQCSDEDVGESEIEMEFENSLNTSHCGAHSQYNAIVEHLSKQSELINSFLPANLLPVDREIALSKIFHKVRRVLADDRLMAEISAPDHFSKVAPICEAPKSDSRCWDDLVNDHRCMICSDLLAGPVILGCSHSFCGICLHEMRDSWESDDSDIRYSCPTCRDEIENEIFERLLDEIIAQKVSLVPDCEAKNDWVKRRDAYIKYSRKKALGKELRKGGIDDSAEDEFYIVAAAMVIIALVVAAAAAALAQSRSR